MSRFAAAPGSARAFALLATAWLGVGTALAREGVQSVVFVCEHGNVKSLIAREWFNRRAAERGSSLRAVSRGITLVRSAPAPIAAALRADGFDVSTFEAKAFGADDLAGAARVVGIGIDARSLGPAAAPITDTWLGIPPATESYGASRDALLVRIERLLDELSARK